MTSLGAVLVKTATCSVCWTFGNAQFVKVASFMQAYPPIGMRKNC